MNLLPCRASAAGARRRLAALLMLLTAGASCASADAGAAPEAAEAAPAAVVDGDLTVAEELDLFRVGMPEIRALEGGAGSREELVSRYVGALERTDTLAIRSLVLNPAEFAFLYYPHTRFTAPPYELGPGLLWYQLQNGSSKGLVRALSRYEHRPVGYLGHRCEEQPSMEGENRVWEQCVVLTEQGEIRLFGTILERDGRFKLVSLANRI